MEQYTTEEKFFVVEAIGTALEANGDVKLGDTKPMVVLHSQTLGPSEARDVATWVFREDVAGDHHNRTRFLSLSAATYALELVKDPEGWYIHNKLVYKVEREILHICDDQKSHALDGDDL